MISNHFALPPVATAPLLRLEYDTNKVPTAKTGVHKSTLNLHIRTDTFTVHMSSRPCHHHYCKVTMIQPFSPY